MKRTVLLPALLVLLAACGGGDDGGGADAKAAYLEQAEAICTKANDAQTAVKQPAGPDGIAAYVRQVVTIASDASAELNALEPPEKDAAELDAKLLSPLREQVGLGQAYAKQVEETAAKGDPAAVLKLLGSAPLQTKADLEWMTSYGFKACVDAADTSS
ncbi:MAG: hypothetical protein JWO60_1680 [Frankiales bacterium]|nr:hypothetical protein [Frankiales bacterium]